MTLFQQFSLFVINNSTAVLTFCIVMQIMSSPWLGKESQTKASFVHSTVKFFVCFDMLD